MCTANAGGRASLAHKGITLGMVYRSGSPLHWKAALQSSSKERCPTYKSLITASVPLLTFLVSTGAFLAASFLLCVWTCWTYLQHQCSARSVPACC